MWNILKNVILGVLCLVSGAFIVGIGTVVVIFCTKIAIIVAVAAVLYFIVKLTIYEISELRKNKNTPSK